jgi:hypothetical protein
LVLPGIGFAFSGCFLTEQIPCLFIGLAKYPVSIKLYQAFWPATGKQAPPAELSIPGFLPGLTKLRRLLSIHRELGLQTGSF